MSKYHPLDVRHPNNRARESKTYLLDPPAQDVQTVTRATRRTSTQRAARSAATAPWGGSSDPAPTAQPTGQKAPRITFGFGRLVIIGGILYALTQSGAFDALFDLLGDLTSTPRR